VLEGSQGYWGKFNDVFDSSFRAALRQRLDKEKGVSVGDPWCLGFFVDNEIAWGDETSLAIAGFTASGLLGSLAPSHCRGSTLTF